MTSNNNHGWKNGSVFNWPGSDGFIHRILNLGDVFWKSGGSMNSQCSFSPSHWVVRHDFRRPPPGEFLVNSLKVVCLGRHNWKLLRRPTGVSKILSPCRHFLGIWGRILWSFFLSRLIFSRESIDYFFFQRKLILRVFWYLNGETRCLGFQDREVFLRFHCCKFPLCDLKVEEIDLGNI